MEDCPSCQRKFKKVEEYPLLYLSEFNKLDITEKIFDESGKFYSLASSRPKGFPKEVVRHFKHSDEEMYFEGHTYRKNESGDVITSSGLDITEKVIQASNTIESQNRLKELENLMGKVVSTSEFLGRDNFAVIPYSFGKDVNFEFGENIDVVIFPQTRDLMESKKIGVSLGIIGRRGEYDQYRMYLAKLAEISYEGRVVTEEMEDDFVLSDLSDRSEGAIRIKHRMAKKGEMPDFFYPQFDEDSE